MHDSAPWRQSTLVRHIVLWPAGLMDAVADEALKLNTTFTMILERWIKEASSDDISEILPHVSQAFHDDEIVRRVVLWEDAIEQDLASMSSRLPGVGVDEVLQACALRRVAPAPSRTTSGAHPAG
ncbi:hypothetical protein ACFW1M_01060 [Streptomyces inhibens]|uniref:hypothetical protein n=1 Tax=Streptomyces inhibens TaxID=2293571 RepID=UPI003684E83C